MELQPASKPLALSLAALQMGALVVVWWVADLAAHRLGLPVPGSVLGLAVLVALLWSGLLPLAWIKAGADLLLAEMLLFFIPAVVAVVKYPALILQRGWALLFIILLGTAAVMVGTAFVVEAAVRAQTRWRR
jgi:holin-like protein